MVILCVFLNIFWPAQHFILFIRIVLYWVQIKLLFMSLLLNIRASNKVYVCMYVTTSIINGRNVFAVIVYLSTGQVVKNKVHVQLLQSFVFNETGG